MTRILLICHATVGEAMRAATETILGGPAGIEVVEVDSGDDVDVVCQAIGGQLGDLCARCAPLVLTDLPGATPHNLAVDAAARLCPGAPVLTGLNLPMLLRAASHVDLPAAELAVLAADGARAAIFIDDRMGRAHDEQ